MRQVLGIQGPYLFSFLIWCLLVILYPLFISFHCCELYGACHRGISFVKIMLSLSYVCFFIYQVIYGALNRLSFLLDYWTIIIYAWKTMFLGFWMHGNMIIFIHRKEKMWIAKPWPEMAQASHFCCYIGRVFGTQLFC